MNTVNNNSNVDESLIDWTPLIRGGHNYKAHQLIVENEHKLTIKATPLHFFVLSLFIVISLIFISQYSHILLKPNEMTLTNALFPMLSLGLFGYGCMSLLKAFKLNKTFDRLTGQYTDNKLDTTKTADKIHLSELKGLQIIDELCQTKESRYISYELNLVLSDSKRINLMDHGNKSSLLNDAQTLSTFLNIPILRQY